MIAEAAKGRVDRSFTRASRLTTAPQFRRVFAEPVRISSVGFTLLYRRNGLAHARLGLAISKKCARRAVDRNRIKRLARESFRRNRLRLPGVDIVVLCSRGTLRLSNGRLLELLDATWATIRNTTCAVS